MDECKKKYFRREIGSKICFKNKFILCFYRRYLLFTKYFIVHYLTFNYSTLLQYEGQLCKLIMNIHHSCNWCNMRYSERKFNWQWEWEMKDWCKCTGCVIDYASQDVRLKLPATPFNFSVSRVSSLVYNRLDKLLNSCFVDSVEYEWRSFRWVW